MQALAAVLASKSSLDLIWLSWRSLHLLFNFSLYKNTGVSGHGVAKGHGGGGKVFSEAH